MTQKVINDVLYLDVVLSNSSQELNITLEGNSGGSGERLPNYLGTYEVNPRKVEQILSTTNKSMERDVVVHPISYSETINESGGLTVVIGQE